MKVSKTKYCRYILLLFVKKKTDRGGKRDD